MQVQIFRNDHAKQERDVKAIGNIISYTELHNRPAAIIVLDDGSFTVANLELLLAAPVEPMVEAERLHNLQEELEELKAVENVDITALEQVVNELTEERDSLKTENTELTKTLAKRDAALADLMKAAKPTTAAPKKVVPGGKSGVKK